MVILKTATSCHFQPSRSTWKSRACRVTSTKTSCRRWSTTRHCRFRQPRGSWIRTSASSASRSSATTTSSTVTSICGWSKWTQIRASRSPRTCCTSWFRGCSTTPSSWLWTRCSRRLSKARAMRAQREARHSRRKVEWTQCTTNLWTQKASVSVAIMTMTTCGTLLFLLILIGRKLQYLKV